MLTLHLGNLHIENVGTIATNHFNSVIASSKWAARYRHTVGNFVIRSTFLKEQNNLPTPWFPSIELFLRLKNGKFDFIIH